MGTEAKKPVFGGAKRGRTADLLHAMQALYQLSYSPFNKWAMHHKILSILSQALLNTC